MGRAAPVPRVLPSACVAVLCAVGAGPGCHKSISSTAASSQRAVDAGHLPPQPVPWGVRWPEAPGWKREALALPPSFAPDMPPGDEELRFSPGFHDAGAKDFWSHAYVWLVPEKQPLDGQQLSDLLEGYYRGLCGQLSSGKVTPAPDAFHANLAPASEPAVGGGGENPEASAYRGSMEMTECMVSGKPLTLRLRLSVSGCPTTQRRAVMVLASPAEEGDLVWHELSERKREFTCL